MTKRLAALLLVFGVTAATLVLALPAAGKGGGRLSVSLSMGSRIAAGAGAGSTTLNVTMSGGKANEAYTLWVANKCYDASGQLISAEYLPVTWAQQTAYPTNGSAGPFTTSGSSCWAYVWQFPASETPMRGVELKY